MARGYLGSIERDTIRNRAFRRVLSTGACMQLVVMTLMPGEEIGEEVHPHTDQFLRVERGDGTVVLEGRAAPFRNGDAVLVPAGTLHNVINTSRGPLHLYTLYAPPQHPPGTVTSLAPLPRRR